MVKIITPTGSVPLKFYEFDQNNSFGRYEIDEERGIGTTVWVEATDADHALGRAEHAGLYFDGVRSGRDCGCCGDRWSRPWRGDERATLEIDPTAYTGRRGPIFLHRIDGSFQRLTPAA